MTYVNLKGYLTFLILWILNKNDMNGSEIAKELGKRKGTKPSPGTIYPALKELKDKKLITANKKKVYSLTEKGTEELSSACDSFCKIFYDMDEMSSSDRRKWVRVK